MSKYLVSHEIAFEGIVEEYVDTLVDACKWIEGRLKYANLDDFDIIKLADDQPNIHEVWARYKETRS